MEKNKREWQVGDDKDCRTRNCHKGNEVVGKNILQIFTLRVENKEKYHE